MGKLQGVELLLSLELLGWRGRMVTGTKKERGALREAMAFISLRWLLGSGGGGRRNKYHNFALLSPSDHMLGHCLLNPMESQRKFLILYIPDSPLETSSQYKGRRTHLEEQMDNVLNKDK